MGKKVSKKKSLKTVKEMKVEWTRLKPYESKPLNQIGFFAKLNAPTSKKTKYVFQNVTVTHQRGNGKKKTYKIVEKFSGKMRTDYFTVPFDYLKTSFTFSATLTSWHDTENDATLKFSKDNQGWGKLKGRKGHKTIPDTAQKTTRVLSMKFEKGKDTKPQLVTQRTKS